nr:immunoglobulin heavy chain junction region [Mus musculus]NSM07735.1 immunoglobulin heavy chain junction region [Mus musculus]
CVRPFDYW